MGNEPQTTEDALDELLWGGDFDEKQEAELERKSRGTTPRVLNKFRHRIPNDAVYVGRPSKWGNPFEIGKHGTREQVIAKHRAWLSEQPQLLAQLAELRGRDLVCWCAPAACHADTLMELANAVE